MEGGREGGWGNLRLQPQSANNVGTPLPPAPLQGLYGGSIEARWESGSVEWSVGEICMETGWVDGVWIVQCEL